MGNAHKITLMTDNIDGEVLQLFPTEVVRFQFDNKDELIEGLIKYGEMLEKRERDQGLPLQKSNVRGWHSDTNIFGTKSREESEHINEFCELINSAFTDVLKKTAPKGMKFQCKWRISGWYNVNHDNSYNSLHTHPGANWSFIFYLEPGQSSMNNGHFTFVDERGSTVEMANALAIPGMFGEARWNMVPKKGLLVMFPSYLQHYVHLYKGETSRVGISGNISITEKQVK